MKWLRGSYCCDVVKDRKNESHSQPTDGIGELKLYCCDVVKDRKNESHSQLRWRNGCTAGTVVTLSKIGKMKAIHNEVEVPLDVVDTVVTLSKIGKMKAIHNQWLSFLLLRLTVVTLSKIGKMKAIHNRASSA